MNAVGNSNDQRTKYTQYNSITDSQNMVFTLICAIRSCLVVGVLERRPDHEDLTAVRRRCARFVEGVVPDAQVPWIVTSDTIDGTLSQSVRSTGQQTARPRECAMIDARVCRARHPSHHGTDTPANPKTQRRDEMLWTRIEVCNIYVI